MQKHNLKFVQGLMFIPFLSAGSPLVMFNTIKTPMETWGRGYIASFMETAKNREEAVVKEISIERARKIDAYYAKRGMPLVGYGEKMVTETEKNNLDWRLIPAIAIKESTGGKFACDYNPFGWGSCKIKFSSWDDAIETVARNLGGNNPDTARYYKDKTTEEKLHHYNNAVVPTYTAEIMEFMELIEDEK